MSKNTDHPHNSSDNKWYSDRNVQLTIIGVVGTIAAAIITILPSYIKPSQNPEPTQTAIVWTATVVELPTETAEPIPPTETNTPAPTETASPSPTPTLISPPISCLDRWEIISSNPEVIETSSTGDCSLSSVPALGISTSKNGISLGVNNFREQGTFGIATALPANATVTLDVSLTVLTQGEFWITLSNTPNPENNMYILAVQPKSGELRTYNDQTSVFSEKYRYKEVTSNTVYSSNPPFIYRIILKTSGNKVNPQIHFTNLPSQIVNLPKYLFIGFNNKSNLGSVSLQAEVSGLTVEIE